MKKIELLYWPEDEDCKEYPRDVIVLKRMWDKLNEIIEVLNALTLKEDFTTLFPTESDKFTTEKQQDTLPCNGTTILCAGLDCKVCRKKIEEK
jgi:hypothetical protein